MLKFAGYKKNFSSLIQLGMLIAAYCHDVDHRGHNNAFEVSSKSPVAILYHDKSVSLLIPSLMWLNYELALGSRESSCCGDIQHPREASLEYLREPF